ncbi:MAG TPA: DUF5655 domain-containing protein [Solirubrobacteraceae bacterium]|nr:DUF5655 domain-containing protein [Solirubrobacteraceae bacterium]
MSVADAIPKAVAAAAKLQASGAVNEANTKAHVINLMLGSLGWDLSDIDTVDLEVKVFDGTFLDYALKLAGAPRLFVEAKSLDEKLDDKKFVAQTINYANNEGVVWCVLTNGIRWRVYKTNESVAMDQKLLFEVDFADASDPLAEKAQLLRLISRAAVEAGELDNFGERVFTDARVRVALNGLAANGSDALIEALTARLGPPPVPRAAITRSLARILDFELPAKIAAPAKASRPAVGPPVPPKGQEYALVHHLGSKGALIRGLFEELDKFALSLGAEVSRRIRKQYIGYFRGKKSFFTAEIQQRRIIVYLGLDPRGLEPWNVRAMRDASKIGHFGMGDTEYSLRANDQLDELRTLINMAYGCK